ncbi:MAG: helix-turn-helix transcriptional regulator [Acidobacteria bacterium]|nr:helix-turn-helix transcriptional regulator [Acidobacteriota bacterium]
MEQSRWLYDLEVRVIELEERTSRLLAAVKVRNEVEGRFVDAGLPEEVFVQIRSGGNPVRVVRKFRKITQKQLSQSCGLAETHISAIETGKGFGLRTALKLAAALQVPAGLIVAD